MLTMLLNLMGEGGGSAGAMIRLFEYFADCISESDFFKFIADLSGLEIV